MPASGVVACMLVELSSRVCCEWAVVTARSITNTVRIVVLMCDVAPINANRVRGFGALLTTPRSPNDGPGEHPHQPEHDEDQNDQAQGTAEATGAIAIIAVVTAATAEQHNEKKNYDQEREHWKDPPDQ